jgi:hypothetical protein
MASVFGQARRASRVSSKHHFAEQHTPSHRKEKTDVIGHNGKHSVGELARQ